MAYSKSKAAYPIWVHMFVKDLADSVRLGIDDPIEKEYETEAEVKKARFEIYGFTAALDHERGKKGADPIVVAQDRETANLARQWMITVYLNENNSKWVLCAKQKNRISDVQEMMNILEARRAKREALLAENPNLEEQIKKPFFKPTLTLEESLERQERERTAFALPTKEAFYAKVLEKGFAEDFRAYLLPKINEMPDPFDVYESREIFYRLFCERIGVVYEEFSSRVGATTFLGRTWDQSRILLGATPAMAVG